MSYDTKTGRQVFEGALKRTTDALMAADAEIARLNAEVESLRAGISYAVQKREAETARAQAAEAALAEARRETTLLTHKILTCGVAASHSDAALSSRPKDYGGPWDSPQAQQVRALRSQRDRAVEVLREVEWRGPRDMVPRCPCCECPGLPSGLTGHAGHAPDCRLDALLGEVGK